MNSKILLISLRDPYLDNDRVMPPLGLMSIYSYLQYKDFDVDLSNDPNQCDFSKYSHVGISCVTPQKQQALELHRKIKNINPNIRTIIGGPHSTYYTKECSDFDHIVVGDGEYALEWLLKDHASLKTVQMRISERELSEFPLPYREPEFLNQYSFNVQDKKASTILTAKGCPMQCAFCESASTTVRKYTAAYVGKQIDQIKKAGFEAIMFFDDLFTLSLERVRELGKEIKQRGLPFRCFGHAKTMTNEMADELTDLGCIEIGFGAESGSQKILDIVNKKTTVAQNKKFVKVCNDRGIKVKAFLMLGLPSESQETIKETELFLDYLTSQSIKNDFDLTVFYPYRGTYIRDNLEKYDLQFEGETGGVYKGKKGYSNIVVRTSNLTNDEIRFYQYELQRKFKERVNDI